MRKVPKIEISHIHISHSEKSCEKRRNLLLTLEKICMGELRAGTKWSQIHPLEVRVGFCMPNKGLSVLKAPGHE